MRLTYVLLSPTFGMHQYTADLANRAARQPAESEPGSAARPHAASLAVRLVTTTTLPRDRYSPAVEIVAPVTMRSTGFSREGLDFVACRRVLATIVDGPALPANPGSSIVQSVARASAPIRGAHTRGSAGPSEPHVVHFTGVHLWNVALIHALQRRGMPVIHTLHDLEPHHGVRFGPLIRLWNRLVIGSGCHILVHGYRYGERLLAAGVASARVTCLPLLHGFLSGACAWPPEPRANAHRNLTVLFFGRVEAYKGVDTLLAAWGLLASRPAAARLIIAGPVAPDVTLPALPPGVELRDRRVFDDEGDRLFRSASLVVLPYRDATQSALIAAAYAYKTPVIVTDSGALSEYVTPGQTGWVVPPGDPLALASALRDALADPGRLAAMGAAGRQWFDMQRRAEDAALRELIATLGRRPCTPRRQ